MTLTNIVATTTATAVLVGLAVSAIALVLSFARVTWFEKFMSRYGLRVSFLVAYIATLSPLIYSNVIGFPPCTLCWWQRIMMFPSMIILARASIIRDLKTLPYLAMFSIIGLGIGIYHYLMQFSIVSPLPCDLVGQSTPCSNIEVLKFGFVTIPFMSAGAFLILAITYFITYRSSRSVEIV